MKRLVFFVEGDGDVEAVPTLAAKLMLHLPDELQWQLFVDDRAFKIGNLDSVTGRRADNWTNYLGAARKRPDLGAVLTILDGDSSHFEGAPFCPRDTALALAARPGPLAPRVFSPSRSYFSARNMSRC
ncbi:hypothetical protein [Fimbriiglobus ruber]|uniref:DUF4276 family protein n=1 Tax=Fimbriiglobus ruber TaxID=1908690 RepID=A0A225E6P8_9BACT|nr:hypothetical protein [Fimbriiglobus ruber]OWK45169.1 hypothetical protein FRUB_01500 [Fimbriiglobus ruber]